MSSVNPNLELFASRLLPQVQQYAEMQVAKATAPMKVEISWLRARIATLEQECERLKRRAAA